jgi:hypothetical protein
VGGAGRKLFFYLPGRLLKRLTNVNNRDIQWQL